MAVRFGYWTPVFGGWLRNVEDEQTPVTFEHVKRIARTAEAVGFDLTLIAELNLNDIKGVDAPSLDAWELAAAIGAVTERLEILTAVRPGYHLPAVAAKRAATIDEITGGRFTLNVVSAWWAEEARQYGGIFSAHDDRYLRSTEFVEILRGLWNETPFSFHGEYYDLEGTRLSPKPQVQPLIYAGGESKAGRDAIARFADAYLTHGGTVEELRTKIADLASRRAALGGEPFETFGMAAYAIVRDTEEEAVAELERITDVRSGPAYESYQDFVSKSQLDTAVDLRDYSVSNRGLRPNLVGTPRQVAERVVEFSRAGVEVFLLQFSPHLPEMERFARDVIPLVRAIEASEG
ncbi:LLM class flavin-dependent oxidoreductase [Microbacterium betulae]|uniref:LLM class flavin-dependent oxidoreductase n=1 Tax=Microbacterium betulae TaxID=2981139 RepID=A0AA97FM35_9MICO|nr:LLM class flavin-dependent oxidoreductase [Microbacterium sp. AB]WOF24534.1 LLM class flavin-dependent oxidoreductase [Microbacterium sp. AB]